MIKYKPKPNKKEVGAKVLVSQIRKPFRKGYLERWGSKIYYVKEILDTRPPGVKLVDEDGNEQVGSYYLQDVLPIP